MAARDLTIGIVELVGGECLERCLAAVSTMEADCVVTQRATSPFTTELQSRFPNVQFMVHSKKSVPERRGDIVKASQSPYVALIEDTTIPAPGWARAAVEKLQNHGAVSGPVSIDPKLGARFIALACSEFHRFVPNAARNTEYPWFAGNHFAARRSDMSELVLAESRLIETDLIERLRDAGDTIYFGEECSGEYIAEDHKNAASASRFHHGRLYAGRQKLPLLRRWRLALRCLLLPLVLSYRASTAVPTLSLSKKLRVLIWIFWFETAWSSGECSGYLFGESNAACHWN
ncbi:MAG: hypothetical protein AAF384_08840 [Pseudomonadota bacterium]